MNIYEIELWQGVKFGAVTGIALLLIGLVLMWGGMSVIGFVLVGAGAFTLSFTLMAAGLVGLWTQVIQKTV